MTDMVLHDYCPSAGQSDNTDCEGKFLQLRLDSHAWLVFSPSSRHRYDNQILASLLGTEHIAHHWVTAERLEYDESRVSVIGGGRFRVNRQTRTLELWDDSHVYGRFDDRGLTQSIARAQHPWSGYRVKIR